MLFAPSRWRLIIQVIGDVTVIRFAGTAIHLHEPDAQRLRETLFRLVERTEGRHLLLDLGNVDFLTSDTVEALLALHRALRVRGGRLSLGNLTPVIAEIFDALRLGIVLDVHPGPFRADLGDS